MPVSGGPSLSVADGLAAAGAELRAHGYDWERVRDRTGLTWQLPFPAARLDEVDTPPLAADERPPVDWLIRLLLLGDAIPSAQLDAFLSAPARDVLVHAGLLREVEGDVAAQAMLLPFEDLLLACDWPWRDVGSRVIVPDPSSAPDGGARRAAPRRAGRHGARRRHGLRDRRVRRRAPLRARHRGRHQRPRDRLRALQRRAERARRRVRDVLAGPPGARARRPGRPRHVRHAGAVPRRVAAGGLGARVAGRARRRRPRARAAHLPAAGARAAARRPGAAVPPAAARAGGRPGGLAAHERRGRGARHRRQPRPRRALHVRARLRPPDRAAGLAADRARPQPPLRRHPDAPRRRAAARDGGPARGDVADAVPRLYDWVRATTTAHVAGGRVQPPRVALDEIALGPTRGRSCRRSTAGRASPRSRRAHPELDVEDVIRSLARRGLVSLAP